MAESNDPHGLVPVFPLPDVVFFPHTVLPLHIFEPRYRSMVRHADASDGLIAMALLGAEAGDHEGAWLGFVIKQVTLGPVVGLAVGWFGGKLMQTMSDREWTEETFQRLSALPMAILAFAFAESVEGNGFIAAFVAGLGFTSAITSAKRASPVAASMR